MDGIDKNRSLRDLLKLEIATARLRHPAQFDAFLQELHKASSERQLTYAAISRAQTEIAAVAASSVGSPDKDRGYVIENTQRQVYADESERWVKLKRLMNRPVADQKVLYNTNMYDRARLLIAASRHFIQAIAATIELNQAAHFGSGPVYLSEDWLPAHEALSLAKKAHNIRETAPYRSIFELSSMRDEFVAEVDRFEEVLEEVFVSELDYHPLPELPRKQKVSV